MRPLPAPRIIANRQIKRITVQKRGRQPARLTPGDDVRHSYLQAHPARHAPLFGRRAGHAALRLPARAARRRRRERAAAAGARVPARLPPAERQERGRRPPARLPAQSAAPPARADRLRRHRRQSGARHPAAGGAAGEPDGPRAMAQGSALSHSLGRAMSSSSAAIPAFSAGARRPTGCSWWTSCRTTTPRIWKRSEPMRAAHNATARARCATATMPSGRRKRRWSGWLLRTACAALCRPPPSSPPIRPTATSSPGRRGGQPPSHRAE